MPLKKHLAKSAPALWIAAAMMSSLFCAAAGNGEEPQAPENAAASSGDAPSSDDAPHAVFVVGTRHYSPHRTMPPLAEQLERFGFRTTVISPSHNPDRNNRGIDGLEQLADADVVIFYVRWLRLTDEQLEHVLSYVQNGGAVVGLRTSTHAFSYPEEHPNHAWNNDFGQLVLGTRYYLHMVGDTEVNIIEGAEGHPLLAGWPEEDVTASGTLYRVDLPEDAEPFLQGTGTPKETGTITNQYGTHELEEIETSPVAWTWTNSWGGRVYGSTLAHERSFENPAMVRLVINGIHWAADLPIPPADALVEPIIRGE